MILKCMLFVIGFAALVPSSARAQDRNAALGAAREIMKGARYCTFITMDGGQPVARVVDPFPPDSDMTVWIGTNALTRKVAQVARDAHATLLCFDPAARGHVSFVGLATVVSDPLEKSAPVEARMDGVLRHGPRFAFRNGQS